MSRNLLRIVWTSRPDPVCVALWQVYQDAMDRALRAQRRSTWSKGLDKWVMDTTDVALDNYFAAVEYELEWLNAE